jgi:hypothetical protein
MRQQDEWVPRLRRAMQAAIGQQLKAEFEPPEGLTPELIVVMTRLQSRKDQLK